MYYVMSCNAIKQNKRHGRESSRTAAILVLQIFQTIMELFGRWTKPMTYLRLSESGDDSAPLCLPPLKLPVMTNTSLSTWLISLFTTS